MTEAFQTVLGLATAAVEVPSVRYRYSVADAIGSAVPVLAPRLYGRTERNFARVLRVAPGDAAARELARQSIRNFARMAIDFLWVRGLTNEQVAEVTALEGEAHLWEAFNARRGVVLVLPHLGCWDVAAARASAAGVPITIVTEASWAARLTLASRTRPGVSIVPRDHSVRPLLRALSHGEAVVLLSDLPRPGLSTLQVPFFGDPAPLPDGPARVSLRTEAPVVAVACVRTAIGRYRVVFRPPLWPAGNTVHSLTARVSLEFECLIRDHLDQWYPFGRIWAN